MKIHFLVYFLYIEAKLWTCLVHELTWLALAVKQDVKFDIKFRTGKASGACQKSDREGVWAHWYWLDRSLQIKTFRRISLVSFLYVAYGTGETLSSSNANSTSIKVNVKQGMNL